jgi:hypothetical protein
MLKDKLMIEMGANLIIHLPEQLKILVRKVNAASITQVWV